jgi:hypothetical protein
MNKGVCRVRPRAEGYSQVRIDERVGLQNDMRLVLTGLNPTYIWRAVCTLRLTP